MSAPDLGTGSVPPAKGSTPLIGLRLHILGNGFVPIPVTSPDFVHPRVKNPGKQPFFRGWNKVSAETCTPNMIASWELLSNHLNTGIKTGDGNLLGLDIDVPVTALAKKVSDLADEYLGPSPLVRVGNAPKTLRCYRHDTPLEKRETDEYFLPDGTKVQVEALGVGQQFVAYGEHPETHRPYEWVGHSPLDTLAADLPVVEETALTDFLMAAGVLFREAGGRTQKELEAQAQAQAHTAGPKSSGNGATGTASFFRSVNTAALANLSAWAPRLFPTAIAQTGTGAYRVRSADLGRDYEEDLSIHPAGIQDFGPRKGLSPIDVMMEFGSAPTPTDAAHTLCEWIGRSPEEFGWEEHPKQKPQVEEEVRTDSGTAGPPDIDISILRLNRRAPPPLPLNVFGHEWRVWIEDVAAASCCPADYVVAPLLSSVSALIGNARWAQAWPGWEEPPNLWTASVGDSGDGKSPGGDTLFRHVLPEIERRMAADFPDQLREWKMQAEVQASANEAWKSQVREAQKAGHTPPLPPVSDTFGEPQSPRLRQNDVTIERVATLLATAAPKGLLMVRDELAGFLLGMSAYSDAARPFWLEAYGGRSYRVERQKHPDPIIIRHLVLSWFGTIQPERLAEVMADADDGLLARFLWLWPEPVAFQRPKRPLGVEFAIRALDRLRQLEMRGSQGVDEPAAPVMVPMSDDAIARLVTFTRGLNSRRDLVAGLLRSTYGKARGLVLRIALVLDHLWWCARDDWAAPPTTISAAATEAAECLVREYLLPMAARTYGDAASTQAERNISTLARWVAQERPSEVHVRKMQREARLPGMRTADDIHTACAGLVDAGWLMGAPRPNGMARAKASYPVNPRLWEALG
jgi:Protein of unknown function (DUF3987)/Bifunctional DNA primase/polymerase, N-terminal